MCCQGCGADLELDDTVRYVTCNYCGSRLEVVRDESVTHTKLFEKLEATTDALAGDLRVVRLQNELARIDREWEQRRAGLLVSDKDGRKSVPTGSGAAAAAGAPVIGGLLMLAFMTVFDFPAKMIGVAMLFITVFILVGVFTAVRISAKAGDHARAEREHEEARRRVLEELEAARHPE